MFLGETPPSFFIEVIIRVFFVYLLLMVSMRLMGKRMSAQLSRNEVLVLVSMAAAIGVPILAPDRGLLHALIIAVVVVTISKVIARWASTNQKFEKVTQDDACTLVCDSVLQLNNMKQVRITPERLFAELRSESIFHLGQVKRLYIEANGSFTLLKEDQPRPGLTVLPDWNRAFLDEQRIVPKPLCKKCGKQKEEEELAAGLCTHCKNEVWVDAVIS